MAWINRIFKAKAGGYLALVGLALGLALVTFLMGNWQQRRAQQKIDLLSQQKQAQVQPILLQVDQRLNLDQIAWRRVCLTGHFVPNSTVYIDNRFYQGRPAIQVVQAFEPEGANFVIPVERGWLLRDATKPRVLPLERPSDLLMVPSAEAYKKTVLQGSILPFLPRVVELWGLRLGAANQVHQTEQQGMAVWSNFDNVQFAKWLHLGVANYVVTVSPVEFVNQATRHQGYAFQWYVMTVVLVFMALGLFYKTVRGGNKAHD